ncbi:MAG: heavy metal translocating P-type ATPase [Candidatus Cyclobacteriaceae bacterium M3_2C_046]
MSITTADHQEKISCKKEEKFRRKQKKNKQVKPNYELIFSVSCGVTLLAGFIMDQLSLIPDWLALFIYFLSYFFGGFFLLKDVVRSLGKKSFDIDLLMLIAAIGAAILGKWSEGALLLFLFSMGHALEHLALEKAHKSIAALTKLSPKVALVKVDGQVTEVPVEDLKVGDIVIVKPDAIITADGIVVKGESNVNQSTITGESIPVEKMPYVENHTGNIPNQHKVFSGTLNGNGYLEIKVTHEAKDSTLSKLIRLVNEAQAHQSKSQKFTKKFERIFVPSILIFIFLLNFAFLVLDETFSQSFYRAITVLVVASPCALVISTPSAVLSGVARAARSGVLIKGGRPLEDLGTIKAVAFDKTGTLTRGEPRITDVIPLNKMGQEQLIKMVISVEKMSDHPLAKAIVKDGVGWLSKKTAVHDWLEVEHFESLTGRGIKAKVSGSPVIIGNLEAFQELKIFPDQHIRNQLIKLEEQGKTSILVRKGDEFKGILAVMDIPRPENQEVMSKLKAIGIERIIMLTGDNQRVAHSVAQSSGIHEAWGHLFPEDKVEAIQKLIQSGIKVAMIGDGVNDAPAMANSTVGIAMGAAGSDLALETADIALMGDNLKNLPFAIGLSQMTRNIIRQNIFISLGVIATMIPLTLLGIASIGPAVLIHEGSTILVVFNALRLLKYDY